MADARAARDERRQHFGWWTKIASRWSDCDAYGHVNNATCYSWFDTTLTTMAMERGILRAPEQTSIGLCVASGCEFLVPIGFPETVDVGVRVGRIGNSSLRYELAIFSREEQPPPSATSPTSMSTRRHEKALRWPRSRRRRLPTWSADRRQRLLESHALN